MMFLSELMFSLLPFSDFQGCYNRHSTWSLISIWSKHQSDQDLLDSQKSNQLVDDGLICYVLLVIIETHMLQNPKKKDCKHKK